jgi:nucleotide-binding universal stress UspA family protein
VFEDILCAVDGTRGSTAAVRMAAGLAGPSGHLTLLAVTAVSGSGRYTTAAIGPDRAKRLLSRAKHIADDAGVASTTVVDPDGPPVKVILERASHHNLLAIGAPATSWLGGMLVGGVAVAALSQFTTPMLIVRKSSTGSLRGRRILVASDGDEGSDEVVRLAGRLGLSLDAPVTLLHAVGRESQVSHRQIQAQAGALKAVLAEASDVCIEPGRPWEVIVDTARSTNAALILIGSRRLSGMRALGSVSRRVAHDAPCSVLLLPPK